MTLLHPMHSIVVRGVSLSPRVHPARFTFTDPSQSAALGSGDLAAIVQKEGDGYEEDAEKSEESEGPLIAETMEHLRGDCAGGKLA
jgi:hypothetical protein